jgi:carbon-monoxide dehydrogenase large subunit
MTENGIGVRSLRKEDQRYLTGKGKYTDDLNQHGQAHAVFVRSPHAHAKLEAVETSLAENIHGVIRILTGEDVLEDGLGGIPCGFAPTGGGEVHEPPRPALANNKVRFVGDLVAVVIGETLDSARQGAEAVSVAYEVLSPVISVAGAGDEDSPEIHAEAPGNLCFEWSLGDSKATEQAFSEAHHVTKIDIINNRKIPNAMEPRAAFAEYDSGSDVITLHTTSQNPHIVRLLLGAFVLSIPEHKLKIIANDVGGGFGSKIPFYPEEAVIAWASRKLDRPIKWNSSRSEAFLSDTHGRDHVTHAELALDASGKFIGLKVDTKANLGAYLSTFGPLIPTYLYATLLAGQYTTPAIYCQVNAYFTNTAPVDAERGAGRPEATFVVERIVEKAAREMGIDPVKIREQNFIPSDSFPYETPVVVAYDSGDYKPTLDAALNLIDYKNFGKRRSHSHNTGKLRGIGISSYIEACGLAPSNVAGAIGARAGLYESAQVRFHPTGSVTVFTGSHSHGQGHETTFSQIVADKFGIPYENVEVIHGDTEKVPFGMGTYGSRSLAVGGSAIATACDKIIQKGKTIAAHLLEASEADINYREGVYSVSGTDRQSTMAEVAFAAYVPHNYPLEDIEPGLDEGAFYDPKNFTFPAGSHICEVEIDPDTGVVEVVNWAAVDDFGNIVNPMIVEGQMQGGIAHGVGQSLLELCIYDEGSGQLVTGSYNDYAMPRADDFPDLKLGFTHTPCPHNPLGVKGCGEAGAIAAPAALMNAVTDALGTENIDMPATPERVWRALAQA